MPVALTQVVEQAKTRWAGRVGASITDGGRPSVSVRMRTRGTLPEICEWLFSNLHYSFGSLIVEQRARWDLRYVFYGGREAGWMHVLTHLSSYGRSDTQHQHTDSRR